MLSKSAAVKITLPSALICPTLKSESFAAMFATRFELEEPTRVVDALTAPPALMLIDFVKSLASGSTPVQAPSAQFPTSKPIVPSFTVMFISPFETSNVLSTPAFRRSPFSRLIFNAPFDVMFSSTEE